jgi:hypothetical protein
MKKIELLIEYNRIVVDIYAITTELTHMNLIFRINQHFAFHFKYLFIDLTKLTPVSKHPSIHNDLFVGREMFIVMTILTNK